jgi:hypothetical protein
MSASCKSAIEELFPCLTQKADGTDEIALHLRHHPPKWCLGVHELFVRVLPGCCCFAQGQCQQAVGNAHDHLQSESPGRTAAARPCRRKRSSKCNPKQSAAHTKVSLSKFSMQQGEGSNVVWRHISKASPLVHAERRVLPRGVRPSNTLSDSAQLWSACQLQRSRHRLETSKTSENVLPMSKLLRLGMVQIDI